jgi:hypothetical protein
MNLPIELVMDVIKYLDYKTQIKLCFPRSAPESIESEQYIWLHAALNGNLSMIKYLHNNKIDGCTDRVMDIAAHEGHLHIIEYLHENRNEGCTLDGLFYAMQNGKHYIYDWIIKNKVTIRYKSPIINTTMISDRFIIFDEPEPENNITISSEQLQQITGNDRIHFHD